MRCEDVFAVIVTFNPDLEVLEALLTALLPQVGGAAIVDNGSRIDLRKWFAKLRVDNCTLELVGRNSGIAAAQNIGIEYAKARGARFVLLSDQDSLPAGDMVHWLRCSSERLLQMGVRLAAVGPRYLDTRQNNPPPFIRVRGLRIVRQACDNPDSIVEVDYLIASGCLIPVECLAVVGSMREQMFIDYVDIEWGLRARQFGFQSYGICAAKMSHNLGDNPISFWNRSVPLHSALRHYYHFRNAVWLYKQPFIPMDWKLADALRLIRKYVFYGIFAKPRKDHLMMMTRGVYHGLMSRLGSYQTAIGRMGR